MIVVAVWKLVLVSVKYRVRMKFLSWIKNSLKIGFVAMKFSQAKKVKKILTHYRYLVRT